MEGAWNTGKIQRYIDKEAETRADTIEDEDVKHSWTAFKYTINNAMEKVSGKYKANKS